jgi:hypothetical protein
MTKTAHARTPAPSLDAGLTARTLGDSLAFIVTRFESRLTVYQLFAATVVFMVLGHFVSVFRVESDWLRVPDRILLPVFMVSVGYNVGQKLEWKIYAGAIAIVLLRWFIAQDGYALLVNPWPANILVTIIIARLVIEPVMTFALRNFATFWLSCLALISLVPLSDELFRYGTLGVLMAMAGWLSRNRGQVPEGIANAKVFFGVVLICYLAHSELTYHFSPLQLAVISAGAAYVFRLLYNFKPILLNSVQYRPADPIARICHFIGRNSLEIYIVHALMLLGLFYYAISA